MYNGQLEMSFGNTHSSRLLTHRQRRLARAQWWFRCMRRAVERATDWEPTPPPRPEQTWLPGSHRQPAAAPRLTPEVARGDQQQVCE